MSKAVVCINKLVSQKVDKVRSGYVERLFGWWWLAYSSYSRINDCCPTSVVDWWTLAVPSIGKIAFTGHYGLNCKRFHGGKQLTVGNLQAYKSSCHTVEHLFKRWGWKELQRELTVQTLPCCCDANSNFSNKNSNSGCYRFISRFQDQVLGCR